MLIVQCQSVQLAKKPDGNLPWLTVLAACVLALPAAGQSRDKATLSPGAWLGAGIAFQSKVSSSGSGFGGGFGVDLIGGYIGTRGFGIAGGFSGSIHPTTIQQTYQSFAGPLHYLNVNVGPRLFINPRGAWTPVLGVRAVGAYQRRPGGTEHFGGGGGVTVGVVGATDVVWVQLAVGYDLIAWGGEPSSTTGQLIQGGFVSNTFNVKWSFFVPIGGH